MQPSFSYFHCVQKILKDVQYFSLPQFKWWSCALEQSQDHWDPNPCFLPNQQSSSFFPPQKRCPNQLFQTTSIFTRGQKRPSILGAKKVHRCCPFLVPPSPLNLPDLPGMHPLLRQLLLRPRGALRLPERRSAGGQPHHGLRRLSAASGDPAAATTFWSRFEVWKQKTKPELKTNLWSETPCWIVIGLIWWWVEFSCWDNAKIIQNQQNVVFSPLASQPSWAISTELVTSVLQGAHRAGSQGPGCETRIFQKTNEAGTDKRLENEMQNASKCYNLCCWMYILIPWFPSWMLVGLREASGVELGANLVEPGTFILGWWW